MAGARKTYEILSEIAHPNWHGVFGMYAKTDAYVHGAVWPRRLRWPQENDEYRDGNRCQLGGSSSGA